MSCKVLNAPKLTVCLVIMGWLLPPAILAQDSTSKNTIHGFVTLFVSGGLSEFAREGALPLDKFDRKGLRTWRGGLTIGMINTRFYQMRLEFGYVGRGAQERFAIENSVIDSKVQLNYVQATWLPVVLKLGWRKFGAFAGAGGYAAYLIDHTAQYTVAGNQVPFNSPSDAHPAEYDYGLSFGGGIYLKNHLLELRLENGINPIFVATSEYAVRNRSLHLILHL